MQFMGQPLLPAQCLFTSGPLLMDELHKHVERLWKVYTLPHQGEKEVTRSNQDKQALALIEARTIRTDVDGILRYATPLLCHTGMPPLSVPRRSVMALPHSTERCLLRKPEQVDAYKSDMHELIEAGVVREVTLENPSKESWYIPHLVTHNGSNRLVFNCSYQYQGQTLNQYLLPGPTLGTCFPVRCPGEVSRTAGGCQRRHQGDVSPGMPPA